jgi:hypothetical protein
LPLEQLQNCFIWKGQTREAMQMIRTKILAALTLALTSASALAQTGAPNAPPAPLSTPNGQPSNAAPPPPAQTAQDQRSRDLFCRRDAAARTGYVTPGQAASHEQTKGTILGTLGGAALGAAIGAAAGNAGTGAAIGAGAGLVGGTAVGADNARAAASDVERAYADAYYACMGEAANYGPDEEDFDYGPPPGAYPPVAAYPPPPPYYYGPYPYPYPYYPYYGPSVTFGFGFGPSYHRGFRHWHR